MQNQIDLLDSIRTGLIDSSIMSMEEYRPILVLNNKENKVINYLRKELASCDEFYFSVAFITEDGLSLLLHTLDELAQKGITGKILTADYLNFNDPKVFRKLLTIPNIQVKIDNGKNFHSKGYIFKKDNEFSIIIGSSNITQGALTKNTEWNMRIASAENGELIIGTLNEFNESWHKGISLNNEWINEYEKVYRETKRYDLKANDKLYRRLEPNTMQSEALQNLAKLRARDCGKALIISATGTGKTFLAAFDIERHKPKRLLFVAHRERLLKSAMASFNYILGSTYTKGLYTSVEKDTTSDIIFASISTLNKDEHLQKFKDTAFDYIIIDEVHRAGAQTYQKLLHYFKPTFLLGMTATPERTDSFNIFQVFDYNIAYEIRLQQALEAEMLCPFHYFGISEINVDGELLSDTTAFNNLVSEQRVDHIIKKATYYGYSGNRLKGLIFCSRNDEANELSTKLNTRGYRTIALSGSNTDNEREDAMVRLEQDEEYNALDYILSVDIFNEGIDIPQVNQIILLRKTQSSIVFIQQLGRGLRKAEGKRYLTVLDFIGNYDNNFLIPISLSGDKSFNKDTLRNFMHNMNIIIPTDSSVEFDSIAKERIYKSINQSKLDGMKLLKKEYNDLKFKLGHIPKHLDFLKYEAIDLQNIIQSHQSYIAFLIKVEKKEKIQLEPYQLDIINYISKELSNAKRIEEICILQLLSQRDNISLISVKKNLESCFHKASSDETITSAINFLLGNFLRASEQKMYGNCTLLSRNENTLKRSDKLTAALKNPIFCTCLADLLEYSTLLYKQHFSNPYKNTNFVLYKKYTRKDVCRLLNWNKHEVPLNVSGYKFDSDTNTFSIFITYQKEDDIAESIKYEDKFINRHLITCVSRNNRTLTSAESVRYQNYAVNNMKIHLFVQRIKKELEFYYLGEVMPSGNAIEVKKENGQKVVDFGYKLDVPVREDIYDFLTK